MLCSKTNKRVFVIDLSKAIIEFFYLNKKKKKTFIVFFVRTLLLSDD